MMNEKLTELITIFLQLNPKPADAQVHALAGALGMDKEALEAHIYELLGEVVDGDDDDVLTDPTEAMATKIEAADEDVLYDPNIDEDAIPLEDVALTDGDPTGDDLGSQQETNDDGADVHDIGVGVTTPDSQDVLTDDGVPSFRSPT